MRINKYLAHKGVATRRGADTLIQQGKVFINGTRALLGSIVQKTDTITTTQTLAPSYRYVLYHKPVGVITHSPQKGERDVRTDSGLEQLFPIGRLDKASSGLLILTNDGRVTDRLLNPVHLHEKEYEVTVRERIPSYAPKAWERGVDIGGYTTKPAEVTIINDHTFRIVLSEGKKHQVRRMCESVHLTVQSLKRIRIMNLSIGSLRPGSHKTLSPAEQKKFLGLLGLDTEISKSSTPPTARSRASLRR